MKTVLPMLLLTAVFSTTVAYAQIPTVEVDAQTRLDASVNVNGNANGNANSNANANANARAQATSSPSESRGNSEERRNANADVKSDNASTTVRGNITAESHRSAVATFVQSLLSVADREGGIGAEVRAVARAQGEVASSTTEAIATIEKRSALMNFLFGTDWKSVGAIRSDIAKTAANIAQLEGALAITTDASVRAELEAQLEVLKEEQEKLNAFVAEKEEGFSLLGWFTKLFVQAEV